jgi:hypothetical protein
MAIEDALAAARGIGAGRPMLFTADAAIGELDGPAGAGGNPQATLTLEAVERVFDRLASVALGKPAAQEGIPTDGEFAARVLILREFMHHLDFASITVVP